MTLAPAPRRRRLPPEPGRRTAPAASPSAPRAPGIQKPDARRSPDHGRHG
jgi:hypothetical protein